jgi:hypothetical protein
MIGVKIESEKLEALRNSAREIGESDNLMRVGIRGVANFLRDWFFALDSSRPNKMGGVRTHFFANTARSIQTPEVKGTVSSVSINQVGLAQRIFGGIIRAGQGISSLTGRLTKYLALPARAEAYGKTPAQFPDLEFVREKRGNGGAMLVQAMQSVVSVGKRGVRKVGERGGLVMFWLVKQVDQPADPTIMPGDEAMIQAAITPAENYLARRLAS